MAPVHQLVSLISFCGTQYRAPNQTLSQPPSGHIIILVYLRSTQKVVHRYLSRHASTPRDFGSANPTYPAPPLPTKIITKLLTPRCRSTWVYGILFSLDGAAASSICHISRPRSVASPSSLEAVHLTSVWSCFYHL